MKSLRSRARLERPISDPQRGRAFAVVAMTLLLATVALTLAGRPPGSSSTADTAQTARSVAVQPRPVSPGPALHTPHRARVKAPRAARRVARRFLTGYLKYLYGHGSARHISGSSRSLRRRLDARPLRVPPAARRRSPRVRSLSAGTRADGGRRWLLTARIADGSAVIYPIQLLVAGSTDRPTVVAIGRE